MEVENTYNLGSHCTTRSFIVATIGKKGALVFCTLYFDSLRKIRAKLVYLVQTQHSKFKIACFACATHSMEIPYRRISMQTLMSNLYLLHMHAHPQE